MEPLKLTPDHCHRTGTLFMSSLSSKLKSTITFASISTRAFCTSSLTLNDTQTLNHPQIVVPEKIVPRESARCRRIKATDAQLKDNWLASLSYPFPEKPQLLNGALDLNQRNETSGWLIGVDPDVSGAVALLKTDELGCSAQVTITWFF